MHLRLHFDNTLFTIAIVHNLNVYYYYFLSEHVLFLLCTTTLWGNNALPIVVAS